MLRERGTSAATKGNDENERLQLLLLVERGSLGSGLEAFVFKPR
jgi:hypothetical protein